MRKLGFIFLSSLFATSCDNWAGMPTDASLLEKFDSRRHEFEKIRDYICKGDERRTVMMDPEWSEPKASRQEIQALYKSFKMIGAKGIYYYGGCSFRLPVWSVGFSGDGDYKYYVYRPGEKQMKESRLADSLDNVDRKLRNAEFYLKSIGDGWYIAFDHWP